MTSSLRQKPTTSAPVVRSAIYTRKSSEEGLDQAFNSLHAQREAGEAYVASQRHEGWQCLPTAYDDGGFSGGTCDRPALQRLMCDIEAGKVDAVVVYKVDRLSRSLLDFARLMQIFEKHHVAFVSVTQQFNTGSSMGRLVLNVLLSFAQFERELAGERTRDKIAAMRRKGKWAGGLPPLGYDVDRERTRLVVNKEEAAQVRSIFALYQQHGSLLPVVEELRRRGWAAKRSTTTKGTDRGGRAFDRSSLHRLLTNSLYVGQVPYKGETYAGEHEAIVDAAVFAEVQQQLARNGQAGGALARNNSGTLLKGILRCKACDSGMTPSFTTKRGRQYRYYLCSEAQKKGRATCPRPSIPAGPVDGVVVDRLRAIGRDSKLVKETVAAVRKQADQATASRVAERCLLEREQRKADAEAKGLSSKIATDTTGLVLQRLSAVQAESTARRARLDQLEAAEAELAKQHISDSALTTALASFDGVWQSLTSREQAKLVAQLVQTVEYDAAAESIEITFHPTGLAALTPEFA